MSKDNVKQMFAKMEKDAGFQKKYADLMLAYQREAEKSMAEKLLEFGKISGFEFSKDDLMAARSELMEKVNENKELSDKDLTSVAGGSGITNKEYGATLSACSLGLGCALASVSMEVLRGSGGCGSYLSSTGTADCTE